MRRRAGVAALLVLLVALSGCQAVVPDGPSGDGGPGANATGTDPANGTDPTNGSASANGNASANGTASAGRAPTAANYSFREVSESVGFDYAALDIGAVNGNNGVYASDYDGDLQTDLLAIGGNEPVLFRNVGGEFERSDALPDVSGHIQGALFFDQDNDGSEDLLLLRRGDTPVFLENDGGQFRTRDVGFDSEFVVPATASAADYTGNGCLDVFVGDYNDWLEDQPRGWQNTRPFTAAEDNGHPNALYRGNCETFERATDAGLEGEHWTLATSFVDFTGDGHPDIHVGNDYFNDTFYTNQGNGTFARRTMAGETDRNAMSSRAVDVTGDGRLDLFVSNIYFPKDRVGEIPDAPRRLFSNFLNQRIGPRNQGNNLLVNTGDGFAYEGAERNVNEGGWGWASAPEDFDSDGQVDIVHSTQFEARFGEATPTYTRPMLFAQEDGEFVRVNASAVGFEESNDRGLVGMDADRSGTVDLAFATDHEAYRFYRNEGEQGQSLQVVVGSGDLDHTTVGTRVEATAGNDTQLRVENAQADYQSQDSRTLHFGLGDAEQVDELRVEWPDGTVRTFEDVDTGQRILLTPDGIEERLPYTDGR